MVTVSVIKTDVEVAALGLDDSVEPWKELVDDVVDEAHRYLRPGLDIPSLEVVQSRTGTR